ncbi:hypothetical protein LB557_06055 [Mesorhizobium sp. BR115XR7A]|uniref:hypothetical protein n=1 Tax=unclassified Mesorhizobium TaxID=325217 RepID=UPI001CC9F76A|nr:MULTISPECIES: hypothetical protein [unclassified Mesorhizobium]MBZ9905561.1 hypothetical protein [Mesorhizobium sp. BR115XR7A]MBZ9932902.1 hypothetical protein [Mesorhizobium sp. BR1-1-5]
MAKTSARANWSETILFSRSAKTAQTTSTTKAIAAGTFAEEKNECLNRLRLDAVLAN